MSDSQWLTDVNEAAGGLSVVSDDNNATVVTETVLLRCKSSRRYVFHSAINAGLLDSAHFAQLVNVAAELTSRGWTEGV